jgi:hypothetical protein
MIIGILLGISLSFFITSLILIFMGLSGVLRENLVTGAVVGTESLISYSSIILVVSFMVTLFFVFLIKRRMNG